MIQTLICHVCCTSQHQLEGQSLKLAFEGTPQAPAFSLWNILVPASLVTFCLDNAAFVIGVLGIPAGTTRHPLEY